jgi:hypothetical protein
MIKLGLREVVEAGYFGTCKRHVIPQVPVSTIELVVFLYRGRRQCPGRCHLLRLLTHYSLPQAAIARVRIPICLMDWLIPITVVNVGRG